MLATLGAPAAAGELHQLVAAIDAWIVKLSAIPKSLRSRGLLQDDTVDNGGFWSPEAYAAIREGGQAYYPIGGNLLALDGRQMRAFSTIWQRIRSVLGLRGEAATDPLSAFAEDISESLQILHAARAKLAGMVPSPPVPVRLVADTSFRLSGPGFALVLGAFLVAGVTAYALTRD